MLPDEQKLYEWGIQCGSKIFIHQKRDHLEDPSMLDVGRSPSATQPSSAQERIWASIIMKSRNNNCQHSMEANSAFGKWKRQPYSKKTPQYLEFQNESLSNHNTMETLGVQNSTANVTNLDADQHMSLQKKGSNNDISAQVKNCI